ncbi:MAG: hypothetical protein BWY57_01233 [Betaproteobacteria bacterium ADurb.Bin341]|nr:MAG: hypothetical protein BWY57_01233 [Betaproteobacteria bacterium ADurb.Bin341]
MIKRPTSVSVVAWILIAMSGISLIASTVSLNNPMTNELMAKSILPVPLQYLMLYLGLLITIVAGIAMLKGQNWARFLYVAWSAIGIAIGLFTSPMKAAMIPGLVVFAVITFFLFRPKANEYFSPKGATNDAQGV